jgi:hypothetical protein
MGAASGAPTALPRGTGRIDSAATLAHHCLVLMTRTLEEGATWTVSRFGAMGTN